MITRAHESCLICAFIVLAAPAVYLLRLAAARTAAAPLNLKNFKLAVSEVLKELDSKEQAELIHKHVS